jgi:ribosomal protein L9
MQILLLKKIGKLQSGINDVKNSYGRFLIREKMAVSCTPENIQSFKEKISFYQAEQKKIDADLGKLCEDINNKFIFITSPVNETGNLYGSIRPTEVVEEIKKQLNNCQLITNQHIVVSTITRPGIFSALLIFDKERSAKVNIVVANSENNAKELYLDHISGDKTQETESNRYTGKNSAQSKYTKKKIHREDQQITSVEEKDEVNSSNEPE